MKNGTVILTASARSSKWYIRLVIWFIRKASGYSYDHTRVWIDGYIYETTTPYGFRKTKGTLTKADGRDLLEPIIELTSAEKIAMVSYFDRRIKDNAPYNYAKLFISLLLYWSRPFFEWLKWVPFQDDKLFGDFCSSAVDEAFLFAGLDILPEGYEEITTPGDFMKSKFFKLL